MENLGSGKSVNTQQPIDGSLGAIRMRQGKRSILQRRTTLIVVVITAIVIAAGVSLVFWGPFSIPVNGEKQLLLIASESGSSVRSGQNITLKIEVFNNGPTDTFEVSHSWPVIGGENQTMGVSPCGNLKYPFGFAIVPGYVTNQSLISEKSLQLWKPGVYSCPAIFPIDAYRLNGWSDQGYTLSSGNRPIAITLYTSVEISGYWTMENPTNGTYEFVSFPAGQYTAVFADEWGAVKLLHFQVTDTAV